MTRLWIVSDLHFEFGGEWLVPPSKADIAVIAGDVCSDRYLRTVAATLPTIFVAGNHDYYGTVMPERKKDLADIPGLHFLEGQSEIINGIEFAGCTLWTDYAGGDRDVMAACGRALNDHRMIRVNSSGEPFDPRAAYNIHVSSVYGLTDLLLDRTMRNAKESLVVVTHHAPSMRSVHPRFAGQAVNHAFASDHERLVKSSEASIWIHGHTHDPSSYTIGKTRVLCNPRGYPDEAGNGFDPNLIVEV